MPQGDRTGPMGQGSRTGRKLGYCSGNNAPGFTKGFGGMRGGSGFRRGMGRGLNFGWFFNNFIQAFPCRQQINKNEEIEMLKQTQREIEKRLNDLENNSN